MSTQTDLTFFSHPVDDETTNQQRKQVGLHYKVLTDTRATGTLHTWATIQVHYTPDPWCRYVTHLSNDAGMLHTWPMIQVQYTPDQQYRYVTHLTNDAGMLHTWAMMQVRYTPEQQYRHVTHLSNDACLLSLDVVFDDVVDELVLVLCLHHAWPTCTSFLHCLLDVNLTLQAWHTSQLGLTDRHTVLSHTLGLTHITAWTSWQTYCIVSHSRPDTHHSLDLLTDILYCLTL